MSMNLELSLVFGLEAVVRLNISPRNKHENSPPIFIVPVMIIKEVMKITKYNKFILI